MAQQTDKQKQEKLLIEIMEADAKDGLYDHIGDTNKMVTMKLYTESQVKRMMQLARETYASEGQILLSFEPIELPSDEEIDKKSFERLTLAQISGFRLGAKYVIDKILNK